MISAVLLRNNLVASRKDFDEITSDIATELCLKELDCLAINMHESDIVVMYQNEKPVRYTTWPGNKWVPVGRTQYDTFETK